MSGTRSSRTVRPDGEEPTSFCVSGGQRANIARIYPSPRTGSVIRPKPTRREVASPCARCDAPTRLVIIHDGRCVRRCGACGLERAPERPITPAMRARPGYNHPAVRDGRRRSARRLQTVARLRKAALRAWAGPERHAERVAEMIRGERGRFVKAS
jgi:hypothetical protein